MEHPAIWLRREGKHAVVLVELGGKWVEVIRESVDSPFSHIKEAVPLTKREQKHIVRHTRMMDARAALAAMPSPAMAVLQEARDACAAACRVIAEAGLSDRLEAELAKAGVKNGFGARMDAALAAMPDGRDARALFPVEIDYALQPFADLCDEIERLAEESGMRIRLTPTTTRN